ncbi:hypothetical protein OID55_10980 [Streptomyces sp. NBC_00715]|uniref:hypothetical protein n=1 Tax=Streptomyces sp. NBC_00715 TaxID=2975811 RepID=UPI003867A1A0
MTTRNTTTSVPHAPRQVAATPGWPPVAIPGRPGWWRHHIDGRQVDLPSRPPQAGGTP